MYKWGNLCGLMIRFLKRIGGGTCGNTLGEENKQIVYAGLMGINLKSKTSKIIAYFSIK
jgi:hypothetical protein